MMKMFLYIFVLDGDYIDVYSLCQNIKWNAKDVF